VDADGRKRQCGDLSFLPTCGSTVYWESEGFPGSWPLPSANSPIRISRRRRSRCARSHATRGSPCLPTRRPSAWPSRGEYLMRVFRVDCVHFGIAIAVGTAVTSRPRTDPTREAARSLQRYDGRARERLRYRRVTPPPGTRPRQRSAWDQPAPRRSRRGCQILLS